MSEPGSTDSEGREPTPDPSVADSVRAAVERTMRATAGSAAGTRERAGELVDDVVRRGREARDELARRGQEAGAELARRGQEATGEVGRRLELLERRLAELERRLADENGVDSQTEREDAPGGERKEAPDTNPEVEG